MVTRRGVLRGSAAALGAVGLAAGVAEAATRAPAAPMNLPEGAIAGFELPEGLVCPVPFMSRAAWGADESYRFTNGVEDWPIELHPVQTLTVHHTGFALTTDAPSTMRTIYRQQALTPARGGIQGWGDIGYNLLIDADGVVYEGRYSGSDQYPVFGPANRQMVTGAHVLHYNTGNIGVCLLGYLNDSPPTPAAQASLVTVLAYLAATGRVNPVGTVNYYNPVALNDGTHTSRTVTGVSGHRDWAATDCPGDAFYALLAQIRQQTAGAVPPLPPQRTGPAQANLPSPVGSSPPTPTQADLPQPGGTNPPVRTRANLPGAGPTPTPSLMGSGSGDTRGVAAALAPAVLPTYDPASWSGSERGGDEYVDVLRQTMPDEFPTVAPTPTPRSSTVDSTVAAAAKRDGDSGWGAGWGGLGAAAPVVLAVGVGAWWLRRRRLPLGAARRANTAGAADSTSTPDAADSGVDSPQ